MAGELLDWQKKAQGISERRLFEDRLGFGSLTAAEAAKYKLDELVDGISAYMKLVPLKARVKEQERAKEKVMATDDPGELTGDWLRLKDYARTTLVLPNRERWGDVLSKVRRIFTASNGFGLIKDKAVENDPCGYTGHNFVMRFGTHPVDVDKLLSNVFRGTPAPGFVSSKHESVVQYAGRYGEIQVNTVPVMYAKMNKESFIKSFGESEYMRLHMNSGVEGGAGHTLYEIYRSAPGSKRGMEAAEISKEYYARIAGKSPRQPGKLDTLPGKIAIVLTRASAKISGQKVDLGLSALVPPAMP